MSAAEAAGDALDKDFSVWFDENCHVVVKSGLELCSGLDNDFFGMPQPPFLGTKNLIFPDGKLKNRIAKPETNRISYSGRISYC